MVRVGLTGGIGSGKSTVSALLAEHGAVVIDADQLARAVVEPGTPGLTEIVIAFGPDVLAADATLDRRVLGDIVFGDEAARRRLETITHPRIRARAAELEAAAPPGAVVVHDIALLVETGQGASFDVVLVVDADEDLRVRRLVADRDISADEARARIAAQIAPARRRAAADHVIRNDGSKDELRAAVDVLWQTLFPVDPSGCWC